VSERERSSVARQPAAAAVAVVVVETFCFFASCSPSSSSSSTYRLDLERDGLAREGLLVGVLGCGVGEQNGKKRER